MGRLRLSIAVLFCAVILAACSGKTKEQPEGGQFPGTGTEGAQIDVVLDGDEFYNVASSLNEGTFLGMQFYQGEPVQLWASVPDKSDEKQNVSVYLYRRDGSRETVQGKISLEKTDFGGYLDDEGNYYGVDHGGTITKLDTSGQELFFTGIDGDYVLVRQICQVTGGRMAVLADCQSSGTGGYLQRFLMELGQDGGLTEVDFKSSRYSVSQAAHLGTWDGDLLLMDGYDIYRVDLQAGTLTRAISLRETSYVVQQGSNSLLDEDIKAVRIPENGKLELLWANGSGKGRCETLNFRDVSKERETVTISGASLRDDQWLREQIIKFNSANDRYRIVLDMPETGVSGYDFRQRIIAEIIAGKGPELLYGETMLDYPDEAIRMGALVDLAPLMEQAGINEDDYFPLAFSCWRTGDAIYSFSYRALVRDYLIKKEVLGDAKELDAETLVNALLAYPEQAVYYSGASAGNILMSLLEGSETLHGMVDWEKGTCDFSGGLLAGMMEVAKRYQYRAGLPQVEKRRALCFAMTFPTQEEYEAEAYVPVGAMFDDGIHPVADANNILFINANSKHPEVAWEFLRFIMSEEVQGTLHNLYKPVDLPVMRSVFLGAAQKIADGECFGKPGRYSYYKLSREGMDELVAYVEDARMAPYRTEQILHIIKEEADGYFNGSKKIPQVLEIIQNRVQVFLDER